MKYTCIQRVIKTVCEDNIVDVSVIKSILEGIKNKSLFCSLTVEIDFQIAFHPKVRILEVNESHFKYRAFSNHAMMKNKLEYNSIKEICLETETVQVCDSKDKDSRWYLLDLEGKQ